MKFQLAPSSLLKARPQLVPTHMRLLPGSMPIQNAPKSIGQLAPAGVVKLTCDHDIPPLVLLHIPPPFDVFVSALATAMIVFVFAWPYITSLNQNVVLPETWFQ